MSASLVCICMCVHACYARVLFIYTYKCVRARQISFVGVWVWICGCLGVCVRVCVDLRQQSVDLPQIACRRECMSHVNKYTEIYTCAHLCGCSCFMYVHIQIICVSDERISSVCKCIYAYVCVRIYVNIYSYVYIYMYIYICVCVYMYSHTYIYIYVYIYISIYIYIYVYAYERYTLPGISVSMKDRS